MNNDVVTAKLDRVRTIKLSNKAMKIVEKTLNCSVPELMSRLTTLSVDEMSIIVYAGLTHEDPTLTIEKVEDLLDEYYSYGDTLRLVTDALISAMGGKKSEDPNGQGEVDLVDRTFPKGIKMGHQEK